MIFVTAAWLILLGILGMAPLPDLPVNDKALHLVGVSSIRPAAAESMTNNTRWVPQLSCCTTRCQSQSTSCSIICRSDIDTSTAARQAWWVRHAPLLVAGSFGYILGGFISEIVQSFLPVSSAHDDAPDDPSAQLLMISTRSFNGAMSSPTWSAHRSSSTLLTSSTIASEDDKKSPRCISLWQRLEDIATHKVENMLSRARLSLRPLLEHLCDMLGQEVISGRKEARRGPARIRTRQYLSSILATTTLSRHQ